MPHPLNNQSMLPLLWPSDKLYIEKTSPNSLQTNDIIAYLQEDKIIAHRLVYISPSRNYFVTKGDNNSQSDTPIKPTYVLGKIEKIKRDNQILHINHIYLTQSLTYLQELTLLNRLLLKNKIDFIVLKGLPLYLHYFNSPPQRLYSDLDILIKKKDLIKTKSLLVKLGFQTVSFNPSYSQHTFSKKTTNFLINLDLHLEPAVAFTKATKLNKLFPSIPAFNRHIWKNTTIIQIENTSLSIPEHNTLIAFLLIHFAHHNYKGIHRLELIHKLTQHPSTDWQKILTVLNRFSLNKSTQPTLQMLSKYFLTDIPLSKRNTLPSHINPFNSPVNETHSRILRLLLAFYTSPLPFTQKLILYLKTLPSYFSFLTNPSLRNSNKNSS